MAQLPPYRPSRKFGRLLAIGCAILIQLGCLHLLRLPPAHPQPARKTTAALSARLIWFNPPQPVTNQRPFKLTTRKPRPASHSTSTQVRRSAEQALSDTPIATHNMPTLDLEQLRQSALALHRQPAQAAILPALQSPPQTQNSALAKAIAQTSRADCRNAYAGGGLLAVIPLAIDTLRDKGCKW